MFTGRKRAGTSSGKPPQTADRTYEAGSAGIGKTDTLWCAQGSARRLWKAEGQRREPLRSLK